MEKTAKDIMQSQVVTVSPDAPLHSTQRLFYEEGIQGAPVVDEQGRVVGMITSTDILRAAAEAAESAASAAGYGRDDLDSSGGLFPLDSAEFQERLQDVTVADFMTEGAVHVAPSTPICEIARIIRENKIHRLLVVENGALRGIVSTFDLVTLLEKGD
jgi:CBS domain-containing protein